MRAGTNPLLDSSKGLRPRIFSRKPKACGLIIMKEFKTETGKPSHFLIGGLKLAYSRICLTKQELAEVAISCY